MRAQTLEEFAQDMRVKGDIRQADMADEILSLIDIEAEVAEPYSNLCDDLNNAAPKELEDKPEKALEWVIDRANMLQDIETVLSESEFSTCPAPNGKKRGGIDADDAVKELLAELGNVRDILDAEGFEHLGIAAGLNALVERAEREAEILTYDL